MDISINEVTIVFRCGEINKLENICFLAEMALSQRIEKHYCNLQGPKTLEYALAVFLDYETSTINMLQVILDKVSYRQNLKQRLIDFLKETYAKKEK